MPELRLTKVSVTEDASTNHGQRSLLFNLLMHQFKWSGRCGNFRHERNKK